MKQHNVTEKAISGNKFYIRPFGAFISANLSGEIMSLITPIIASVAPALSGAVSENSDDMNLLDIDAETVAPALAKGLAGISGDKIEKLLKKLLVQHKNIAVELEGEKEPENLTEDIANEIFCGDTQDMFILAFEVIKVNYSGFFKSLGGQFGKAVNGLLQKG